MTPLEKLELFSVYLRGKSGQARNVPARACQAGDKPVGHRIVVRW